MGIYELKNHREVCWDTVLVGESENVTLDIHKPVWKNVVMDCDHPWETVGVNYLRIMKVGERYRIYYRARDPGFWKHFKTNLCVAESEDGKVFTRCAVNEHEFDGAKENNIHHAEDRAIDNFSVFYDENPDCPADAKFKALSCLESWLPNHGGRKMELLYFKSGDGIRFEKVGVLPVPGVFDSYNVVLWDDAEKEYKLYVRDFHDVNGTRRIAPPKDTDMAEVYRDVRLSRSKDFVNWTPTEMIEFSDGNIHMELYTNQIVKYPRAYNMYLGLPSRYNNRPEPKVNYNYLPDWNGERIKKNATGSRMGTVFNDTGIMTSRDGFHFDRWDGAYMTPGLQRPDNWYYEDCYLAYGMVVTDSDEAPGTPEISLYRPEGYNVANTRIVRYTVRMDGFYSWHAPFSGGVVTTVPVTFDGDALELNYATSALGHMRVLICDEAGTPIEGYDSGILWGDTLSRNVDFEKPLRDLCGKAVRIRFEMKDCDLYSFKFN